MFLIDLFVLGTLWFWLLVVVASGVLLWAIEEENGTKATVTMLVTGAIVALANHINVFGYVWNHWVLSLLFILGYFACGTGWAIAKWTVFLHNKRDAFLEYKDAFYRTHDVPPKNASDEYALARQFEIGSPLTVRDGQVVAPQVRSFKSLILMWMTYWPWSFVWTVINDPVKKAFKKIYSSITGLLQSISDKMFAKVTVGK